MLKDLKKRKAFILAISQSTQNDVIEYAKIPPEQIIVTYLGVAQEHFYPRNTDKILQLKVKYALPVNFYLFVGAISPRKNITTLLTSFERFFQGGNKDLHLVIAGPPIGWKDGAIYKLWDRLLCKNNIHFTGFITEDDLPALYSAALAFVYPSLNEGFGLPVLEAMACGTPVICSNSASLPEVAGDSALFVSPMDPDGFIAAFRKILNKELRAQYVDRGLKRARDFRWEVTAQRTLEAYNRITGRDQ
jgi:alpha-1,3-rhamnosyl/mannosyltransferase